MQPRENDATNAQPKTQIVLTPVTAGVLVIAIVALAVALRFLPVAPAPEPPAAPAYPDLRPRVADLEQQLLAARTAVPAYPDLSAQVTALEAKQADLLAQLAEAQAAPEYVSLRNRLAALESELTATRDALAVAKKGDVEAQLRIERDDLAGRTARLTSEVTQLRGDRERMQKLLAEAGRQMRRASAEKTSLSGREAAYAGVLEELQTTRTALATAQDEASRANEALAAQQQSARLTLAEAATDRARLDQLRSTNTVLTQENQRLKSALARGRAAAPPPAAAATIPGRTHLVAAGDSLSNLSDRYYGTPGRWREIYVANADLLGPTGTLRIGTTLTIP